MALDRQNFGYEIDGGDLAIDYAASPGMLYDFCDRIAKIGTFVHVWPGFEPNYVLMKELFQKLRARKLKTCLVVRPFEYRPKALTITEEIGITAPAELIFDSRSHSEKIGMRASDIEEVMASFVGKIPSIKFVQGIPTQGFMKPSENVEHYGLDGAQHICPSLNFNYYNPRMFEWLKVRWNHTICGGMRWFDASGTRLERWLLWCSYFSSHSTIFKYEGWECLKHDRHDDLIATCKAILGRWQKILMYSANVFVRDEKWLDLFN